MAPARGHHHVAVRGRPPGPEYTVVKTQSEAWYLSNKVRGQLRFDGYSVSGPQSEWSASKAGAPVVRCEVWRCEAADCREWAEAQRLAGKNGD